MRARSRLIITSCNSTGLPVARLLMAVSAAPTLELSSLNEFCIKFANAPGDDALCVAATCAVPEAGNPVCAAATAVTDSIPHCIMDSRFRAPWRRVFWWFAVQPDWLHTHVAPSLPSAFPAYDPPPDTTPCRRHPHPDGQGHRRWPSG